MNENDRRFLWNLMPEWVKESRPGIDPTMYGTGSYEGDCEMNQRVRQLLMSENVGKLDISTE